MTVKGIVDSSIIYTGPKTLEVQILEEHKEEPKVEENVLSAPPPYQPTNLEQTIAKALRGRCILFGQNCDPYFAFLDNDCPAPFEFGGTYYTCATTVYEAQKFAPNGELTNQIKTLDAKKALAFSAEKHLEKNREWYEKREIVMLDVLRAKFGQNYTLQRLLLLTMDSYLSFHTPLKRMDPFWTDDSDGTGCNRLGHLLMSVRKGYGGMEGISLLKNYPQLLPKEEMKKTLVALDKSDADVFSEINDLNAQINEDVYKLHSQTTRREDNHPFTRFPFNNFPYDATLVPLNSGRYINASFVLGKKFIGTQSPMPHTTEDFWSMVLEQNASIVIMLNRLTDPGDDIYFPFSLSDKKNYGKIHLELIEKPFFKTDPSWRQAPHEEEPHAVIHRKVRIWQEGKEARIVNHFQYQNWRDFSPGNERAAAYLVKTVHGLRTENTAYCTRPETLNFDSARQSQIEAERSDRRSPAPSRQGEETAETRESPVDFRSAKQVNENEPARREDRFDKVAASQNSKFQAECSISPIVVHCHAGVGRTSALITLIDQFEYLPTGKVDVKRCLQRQRSPEEGRCNSMMQSRDQYLFCYRTLRLLAKLAPDSTYTETT